MESEGLIRDGFGGSLPVENVQALASKNLKDIPSRYIRPEVEFDVIALDESLEIPVIDRSKLGHADELEKLHWACKDWGFFQVPNLCIYFLMTLSLYTKIALVVYIDRGTVNQSWGRR